MRIRSALLALAISLSLPVLAHASGETVAQNVLPGSASATLSRALDWQNAGNYERAIAEYDAALEMDGLDTRTRVIALYNRGLCHQQLGAAAAAIDDFTRVLSADPAFAQAWQSRGNVFLANGRADLALADYAQAIDMKHPRPELSLFGQARAYQLLGEDVLAGRMLERAIVIEPGFMQARVALEGLAAREQAQADADLPEYLRGTLSTPVVGMVGAVLPDAPDANFTELSLPSIMRAPDNLLDQAEMVMHSRITVSSLQTLILSQTPALDGPGLVVAETRQRAKDQARVDEVAEGHLPMPKFIRVEAAATAEEPKVAAIPEAEVTPQISPFIVLAGAEKSEADAWKQWDKLKSQGIAQLDGLGAEVVEAKRKGKTVFRLQIPVESAKDGKALCAAIKGQLASCEASARS